MVPNATVIIDADVHADNPQLAFFDPRIAVSEINVARSQGFYLRSLQRNARFKPFDDLEFVKCFTIGGDGFCSCLVQGATPNDN